MSAAEDDDELGNCRPAEPEIRLGDATIRKFELDAFVSRGRNDAKMALLKTGFLGGDKRGAILMWCGVAVMASGAMALNLNLLLHRLATQPRSEASQWATYFTLLCAGYLGTALCCGARATALVRAPAPE